MQANEAQNLLKKYKAGEATPEEIVLIEQWLLEYRATEESGLSDQELQRSQSRVWDQVLAETKPARRVSLWPRIAAAASILIALSVSWYVVLHKKQPPVDQLVKNDIKPGHNQATLTLANGQKIILTKGLSGQLAIQNNTTINATGNTITYNAKNQTEDQLVNYNTLATAQGEQSPYPLVLPDGTQVWLNAESSITFPTAFNGKERIVKITGEALFEVKHNAAQPFKVQTAKQTIEDIGTTFDVNAYTDEPATKTTLVEGKVKVGNLILTPGQQTDGTIVKNVNTQIFTAWKEGNFHFEGDNIQTIMRQLARWYNIDVTYQGKISDTGFYGDISRNRNISAVLKLIEKTNALHFKIEGRRVIVID